MQDLVFIGGTGGCADLIDLANQINCEKKIFNLIGVIDDNHYKLPSSIFNVPILGGRDRLDELINQTNVGFITAIGNQNNFRVREEVISSFVIPNNRWIRLIHPTAIISDYSNISLGASIHAFVAIGPNVTVGAHSLILPHVVIGHDTLISDYSIINAGCKIAGNVKIGQSCYLGLGASVRDHIEIGSKTLIGMGASVIRDCQSNAIYFGLPATKN